MQKITPCLWFDSNAEEAMNFYVSAFSNALSQVPASKIVSIKRYPDEVSEEFMKGREGKVLTGIFEVAGYRFICLDGGPAFKMNPSISFHVHCNTVEEVDALWAALSKGGNILMPLDTYFFSKRYGWVEDRYGVSWQISVAEESAPETIFPAIMYVGERAGVAEEAINFYTSVFKDTSKHILARYGAEHAPEKDGTVMYAEFTLNGERFAAMDSASSHEFQLNEGISFQVECETQAEVDHFWEALSAVPESEQCGWLKDKFGVSWQIIPRQLGEMLDNPDEEKSGRVLEAMLKMKKIDLSELEAAFEPA